MSEAAQPAPAAAPLPLPVVPATRTGRVLSFLARYWWISLTLICLALWTPGVLSLPPLDRDESRFAPMLIADATENRRADRPR